MTQKEVARELKTSRANASMIELRARRKVAMAMDTIAAYKTTLTEHVTRVPKGTAFYDIPPMVLREGDRWGIHVGSNVVEIIRMVKDLKPSCLQRGRTTKSLSFVFSKGGKLRVRAA